MPATCAASSRSAIVSGNEHGPAASGATEVLVGIDMGTTRVKAVAVDLHGAQEAD